MLFKKIRLKLKKIREENNGKGLWRTAMEDYMNWRNQKITDLLMWREKKLLELQEKKRNPKK